MNQRYKTLHTIGTLAVILAWVFLVVGIIAAIASWTGIGGLADTLTLPRSLALLGVVPSLLFGIFGWLQFYVIGKALHVLVGLDETTLNISDDVKKQAATGDAGDEIAGELKRQAMLIASNLESTQQLQEQLAALDSKMDAPPALEEATSDTVEIVAAEVDETADEVIEVVSDSADDIVEVVADASDEVVDAAS